MESFFVYNGSGQHLGKATIADDPLGRGGEGAVYPLKDFDVTGLGDKSQLVAKIYNDAHATNTQCDKIAAMVSSRPNTPSISWPLAVLINERTGKFGGFIMKRLDFKRYKPFYTFTSLKDRRAVAGNYDIRYALTTCLNLAIALQAVHDTGAMVGDINESNIFVAVDATVFIVDADSAQITSKKGKKYRCNVGKPEYTAPELSYKKLSEQDRTLQSEVYAYAVCVFQLLTAGRHPTDGVYKGSGEAPNRTERMRRGILPTFGVNSGQFQKIPSIPSDAIPKKLAALLVRALSVDPAKRPRLQEFIATLKSIIGGLKQCQENPMHYFDGGKCLWCEAKVDIWGKRPPPSAQPQVSLPPLSYSQPSASKPKPKPKPKPSPPLVSNPSLPSVGNVNTVQPPISTPAKYHGKTVLVNQLTGVPTVRPPLRYLPFRVAFHCVLNETPKPLKFFFLEDDDKPALLPLILGIIFCELLGGSLLGWQEVIYQKITGISIIQNVHPIFVNFMVIYIIVITNFVTLSYFICGVYKILSAKKKWRKYGYRCDTESRFATLLRPIMLLISWFFFGVVIIIFGIIALLMWVLHEIFGSRV